MMLPIGKYSLELNFPGDGSIFLNWWDYYGGDDVVAEIKDGKLFISNDEKEEEKIEITFPDFLKRVIESINNHYKP